MVVNKNLGVPKSNNDYRLAGNLLVPFDVLNSMSESEVTNLQTTIDILKAEIVLAFLDKNTKKDLFKARLSKDRELCATYKNNKLDFFIRDFKTKEITQELSSLDIEKIEWREKDLIKRANEYINDDALTQERRNNIFLQSLIASSYKQKLAGRSPPLVFGMKLNDNVNLDTEEGKDV